MQKEKMVEKLTAVKALAKNFCTDCPCAGDRCLNCSTYENIKDLEKQYEELAKQFESGCAG